MVRRVAELIADEVGEGKRNDDNLDDVDFGSIRRLIIVRKNVVVVVPWPSMIVTSHEWMVGMIDL
jgi:hypothetical protein